jgi:hypothetical protein
MGLLEKHGAVMLEAQLNMALTAVGAVGSPAICGALIVMTIKYIIEMGIKRITTKVYILSKKSKRILSAFYKKLFLHEPTSQARANRRACHTYHSCGSAFRRPSAALACQDRTPVVARQEVL